MRYRLLHALIALCGLSVLGLARWMEPSVAGHSTHTQLGLPGCTFLTVSGIPCPMCGATTTWSLMVHGRWWAAMVNQPFAALLFGLTVATIGVSAAEALQPRGRWRRIEERIRPVEPYVALGFLAAMMAGWLWKIAVMS